MVTEFSLFGMQFALKFVTAGFSFLNWESIINQLLTRGYFGDT